jgi:hypothetical protein
MKRMLQNNIKFLFKFLKNIQITESKYGDQKSKVTKSQIHKSDRIAICCISL